MSNIDLFKARTIEYKIYSLNLCFNTLNLIRRNPYDRK